ncbi:MAG: Ig-like domain-containing protein [Chitinophagales bacterium]|nr:tandem-95 repeat protein [Bacteroidota bacterium]MCB9043046.1 tandem-95 repeat protein [Chitinophagales bacterium]
MNKIRTNIKNTTFFTLSRAFSVSWLLSIALLASGIFAPIQAQQQLPCGGDTDLGDFCVPAYTPGNVPQEVFCVPGCEDEAVFISGHNSLFGCGIYVLNDTCFRYSPLPAQTGTDEVIITVCSQTDSTSCSDFTFNILISPEGCGEPVCAAEAGSISLSTNTITVGGNVPIPTVTGAGTGIEYTYIYVLTQDLFPNDNTLYNIIDTNTAGNFNSNNFSVGNYQIWGISYKGTYSNFLNFNYLSIDAIQAAISLQANNFCADVTQAANFSIVEVVNECNADGGSLSLSPNTINVNQSSPNPSVSGAASSSELHYFYLLTNSNNEILQINSSGVFQFNTFGIGSYKIWGISIEGDYTYLTSLNAQNIQQLSAMINNESICADFSNFVSLNVTNVETCTAEAGTISLSTNLYYVGDEIPSVQVSGQNTQSDYLFLFVLTANLYVGDGISHNIVAYNTDGNFDFANLPVGDYRIWGVSFKGTLAEYEAYNFESIDVIQASGASSICIDTSGFGANISVQIACQAEAGTITMSQTEFMVDDAYELPQVSGQFAGTGYHYFYILTQDTNPNDNVQYNLIDITLDGNFDFTEFGTGTYQIFGISYKGLYGTLVNQNYPSIEAILAAIDQGLCADISTPLGITVTEMPEECSNVAEFCAQPIEQIEICPTFCNIAQLDTIDKVITTFNCSIEQETKECILYRALPAFEGLDSVIIVGQSPTGQLDTFYAYIQVGCTQPVAMDDNYTTPMNTNLNGNVVINDTDPCNNILSTNIITQAQHGTVVLNIDGTFTYTPNNGYTGTDIFAYEACNICTNPMCDEAIVTITVSGQSDAVNAADDTYQTLIDNSLIIDPLQNDTGIDISLDSFTQPQYGSVEETNGVLVYTPNDGYSGTDTFEYTICNEDICDTAIVTITVFTQTDNMPPIAQDDIVSVNGNTNISVLLNDSDPDNQTIAVGGIITPAQHGTTSLNDNVINYLPEANYEGSDSFSYYICDNGTPVLCDTATVYLNIVPIDPNTLFAVSDTATTLPNIQVEIEVLNNDLGINPVIISYLQPQHGTVTINGQGNIIYTPAPGFEGVDTFIYTISDSSGNTSDATVYVTVGTLTNQAPVAVDDSAATPINEAVAIPVLSNDYDPEGGDVILNQILVDAMHGSTEITAGQIYYTPDEDFSGLDTLQYIICDLGSPVLCDTAFVYITIGELVIAQPDVVQTPMDTPIEIFVLQNDSGNDISITVFQQGENGSVFPDDDNLTLTYVPTVGFSGVDYFFYTICDGNNQCDSTLVSVTVVPADINLPPHADNDVFFSSAGESVNMDLLQNDSDPNQDNIYISFVDTPSPEGEVFITNQGSLAIFVPDNADFTGEITFNYTICDNQSPELCDEASVIIYIDAPISNNYPQANNDNVSTIINTEVQICPLDNDSDADQNQVLTYQVSSEPANGTYTLDEDGCIVYIPDENYLGIDYMTYVLCDDGQPALCDTAYIQINIGNLPIEDVIAVDDIRTTQQAADITIDVLTNDTGSDIHVISFTQANNGTVSTIENNPDLLVYMPNSDFAGVDTFSYIICNPLQVCDTALVIITVVESEVPCEETNITQGITPNRDGINDIFVIPWLNDCYPDADAELIIYNRWGNIVFQKTGYMGTAADAWDGTWDNSGEAVPDGTYFYLLQYNTPDGAQTRAGYIEVLK